MKKKGKWKCKFDFKAKSNLKKHDVMISLLPTIGIMTSLYNKRNEDNIVLMILFVQMQIAFRYEN